MVFSFAFATAVAHITSQDAKASEAKTKEVPPIQADRPTFSNSASITPLHTTVVELGYRVTTDGNTRMADYGDGATVRLPATNNLEFKLFVPSRLIQSFNWFGPNGEFKSYSDSGVGLKYRLSDSKGPLTPATAVSLGTTLPTGDYGQRTPHLQPELRGLFSFELTEKTSLDVNLAVSLPSESAGSYTRYALSASYQLEVKPTWTLFAEGYTNMPGSYGGRNETFGDFGVQKLVSKNLVVDAFYGNGFGSQSATRFYGFGFGYRF